MSPMEYARSQNVADQRSFLDWADENRHWVDLYRNFGERQSVMDAILASTNNKYQHWKTVMENFYRTSRLSETIQKFSICEGHSALTSLDLTHQELETNEETCSVCSSAQSTLIAKNSLYYIPLKYRVELMVQNEVACEQLFENSYQSNQNSYDDFYSGLSFKHLVQKLGGVSSIQYDLFLAVSTDAFLPYDHGQEQVWPILALLLNLPPHLRYLNENIIPLGFFPGPSPADLTSFFTPLINEVLEEFGETGLPLLFFDGIVRRVRVHVVWILGDIPVIAKLSGTVGHTGRHPCRFCTLRGTYVPESKRYYYPSRVKDEHGHTNVVYDLSALNFRTDEGIQISYAALDEARCVGESSLRSVRTSTGVKQKTILLSLPSIVPFYSFPVDIMHLFFNVSKDILSIWIHGAQEEMFNLSSDQIKFLDCQLQAINAGVPSSINCTIPALVHIRTWKAADFKHFCLNVSTIILENVMDEKYLDGWYLFVQLYDIAVRSRLSLGDVEEIGAKAIQFVQHFEDEYIDMKKERLRLAKNTIHLLLHLKDNIIENGPPTYYSQFWMERYIGRLVFRLNARKNPSLSLFRACLFEESAKIVYDDHFKMKSEAYDKIALYGGWMMDGKGRRIFLQAADRNGIIKRALLNFFQRKWTYLSSIQHNNLLESIIEVIAFPTVKVLRGNGTDAVKSCCEIGDLWKLSFKSKPSYYCAAHMNEDENGADVYYGRVRNLIRVVFDPYSYLVDNLPENTIQFDLVIMDWALRLTKGNQEQVRCLGPSSAAFSGISVEDLSVVNRKIAVVDHAVPSRNGSFPFSSRTKAVTSFVDEQLRSDHLLHNNVANCEGHNLVLRGFTEATL